MKYLTIGLGILAVLLCLSLVFSLLSVRYLREIEAPLREVESFLASGDFDAIRPLTADAQDRWDEHLGFFSSLLSHGELDEVSNDFASLSAYAALEELPDYCAAHARLCTMLAHLRDIDQLRYYNFLCPIVNQFESRS